MLIHFIVVIIIIILSDLSRLYDIIITFRARVNKLNMYIVLLYNRLLL